MTRRANAIAFTVVLLCGFAHAANEKLVDSATFAIYVNGKKAATEKFEIRQGAASSSVRSEFRTEDGKSQLRSEMQVAGNGSLVRYDLREIAPGKMMTSIEPVEMFLVQRTFTKPGQKRDERPYVMPHSTVILDDYFFSQRQVLLWRYLAQSCTGQPDCVPQKAQFGAIIPQQQSAISVNVDFGGPEKVMINGIERELDRFNIVVDDGTRWSLWMDKEYKVHRIVIADGTEIVRL